MEYLSWTTLVLFLLHCMTVQSFPRSPRQTSDCRRCKPGYYAHSLCTDTRDTLCRRCPDGHFTSEWNVRTECYPCSKCGQGLFELKQCSRTSDTFCESCSSSESRGSARYKEYCWGLEPDAADFLSDQPEPDGDKDLILDKGNGSYLALGDNDDGGEKDLDDSSGQVELKDGKDAESDPKTTDLQQKGNSDQPAQDITEVDLEDGSGYVIEEPIVDEELSDLLSQSVTVGPIEAEEDELIPVGKGKTVVSGNGTGAVSTTTPTPMPEVTPAPQGGVVDLNVDDDGSGLVVEDVTNITVGEDLTNITVGDPVMITEPPGLTEDISEILVEINYSGDGEEIADGSTPTSQDIILLTVAPTAADMPIDYAEVEVEEEDEALLPPEENKVGASVDEEPVAQGGMDGKTRTAVIVGVACGAVVFFALGFFASRQCKKRHSFKSMKKIDSTSTTQNGSPEAIEFRGGRNSGKYDPGAYERSLPVEPQTESVVLLSSKPLPIDHDRHVNGIDKIRYMDETTDEEPEMVTPRDRLLKESSLRNEEADKGNNSLSNDVLNKLDDKLAPIEEERQPMLTKGSEDTNETS